MHVTLHLPGGRRNDFSIDGAGNWKENLATTLRRRVPGARDLTFVQDLPRTRPAAGARVECNLMFELTPGYYLHGLLEISGE